MTKGKHSSLWFRAKREEKIFRTNTQVEHAKGQKENFKLMVSREARRQTFGTNMQVEHAKGQKENI